MTCSFKIKEVEKVAYILATQLLKTHRDKNQNNKHEKCHY